MKKETIYIIMKNETGSNVQSFYLISGDQKHYLFSQKGYRGVSDFFSKARTLDSIRCKKAHEDYMIIHTMEKLPKYIRYIEKETGLSFLNKTRKNADRCRERSKSQPSIDAFDFKSPSVEMMDDVR